MVGLSKSLSGDNVTHRIFYHAARQLHNFFVGAIVKTLTTRTFAQRFALSFAITIGLLIGHLAVPALAQTVARCGGVA